MVVIFKSSQSRAQDSIYRIDKYVARILAATVAGCDCTNLGCFCQRALIFADFFSQKAPISQGSFPKQTWRFHRELWGLFCFVCACTCVSVPVFIPVSVPISVLVFVPVSVSIFIPISVPISVSVPACQIGIQECILVVFTTCLYVKSENRYHILCVCM